MAGNNLIPGFAATSQPGSNKVVFHSLADGNGSKFYVDSGSGSNNNSGLSPDQPVATIDYAVGLCTSNQGDIIYVLPGHAETVSAAGGLDLDVPGITIIGFGDGANQPTVTLDTATTADVDIDSANVTVRNIHFIAGFADVVAAIDVNADDFTIEGCRFTGDNAGLNANIWIQDAGAGGSDRITVENCYCEDRDAANTHFINFAGTGNGHRIVGNVLHGDFGTMAIGGAGVITNCLIRDNIINNAATTVDSCINLAGTATGSVYNNHCAGAAAQANGVTATACLISQNYYGVLAEDLSAILDPIAT
jgi:hypothetical protein